MFTILLKTPHGWTTYLGPGENSWDTEASAEAACADLATHLIALPAMAKQHHATDDEWAVIERANQRPMPQVLWSTASCILELRDRIQQLEAAHPPSPAADKILALQDQVRDGALTLAEALMRLALQVQQPTHFAARP